jgi:hypothetical protein
MHRSQLRQAILLSMRGRVWFFCGIIGYPQVRSITLLWFGSRLSAIGIVESAPQLLGNRLVLRIAAVGAPKLHEAEPGN